VIRRAVIIILISICGFLLCPVKSEARLEINNAASEAVSTRIDDTNYPVLYVAEPCLEGDAIWLVQARLRELGYEINPSGSYDATTGEAIKMFQLANHLPSDGVVSKPVWECLMYDEPSETCSTGTATVTKTRIEIDLSKHNLKLFQDEDLVKEYPVGVGKWRTPSPLGEWKIVHKGISWGNGFGTRWMGLNVPWGIYGIHGTDKPYSVGASLSHGCIRMRNRDVEDLYPRVPEGTRVKIMENGQIFPKNFGGRKLNKKCTGQNVVYLQSRLKEKGIIFDAADGRFGNMTELAVKYYQIWHGLEPTGIADAATYRSLGMIQ